MLATILNLDNMHLAIYVICTLVLLILLVCITVIDIRTRSIPNVLVLAVLIFGCIYAVLTAQGYPYPLINISLGERFFGALLGFAPLFLLNNFIGGIGGGDIKLLTCLGFVFGFSETFILLIATCIFGGLAGIIKLIFVRGATAKSTLAYGPYIALGALVTIIFDMFFSGNFLI